VTEAENIKKKCAALAGIARALNGAKVTWAVGASALLYFYELTDTFNDFDLLICLEDIDRAKTAIREAGAQAKHGRVPADAGFASAIFEEYQLDGADFDVLCDFTICRKDALYRYPFSAERVAGSVVAEGENIPLAALEDWYVLYLLMSGRGKKATMIARRLKERPEEAHRERFSYWLNSRLPGDTRERVFRLFTELAPD
jgi:hypothetical protein